MDMLCSGISSMVFLGSMQLEPYYRKVMGSMRRINLRKDVGWWRNSSKILSLTKVKYDAQN